MNTTAQDIPLLVNCDHPLADGQIVDLEEIKGAPDKRCERRCAQAVARFMDAAVVAGFHPRVISAYRDAKSQQGCFGRVVDRLWARGTTFEEALAEAQRYVASPGASEHQTGLAVDIKDADYKGRDYGVEHAPGQLWLMSHCHEFGFILRYPPDKEHLTHVAFEPCHFRFVGKHHAAEITKSGLTLEEYVSILEDRAQDPGTAPD